MPTPVDLLHHLALLAVRSVYSALVTTIATPLPLEGPPRSHVGSLPVPSVSESLESCEHSTSLVSLILPTPSLRAATPVSVSNTSILSVDDSFTAKAPS